MTADKDEKRIVDVTSFQISGLKYFEVKEPAMCPYRRAFSLEGVGVHFMNYLCCHDDFNDTKTLSIRLCRSLKEFPLVCPLKNVVPDTRT